MAVKIKLNEIPFFKYVAPGALKGVAQFLKVVNKEPNSEILLYNQKVPGLYIIVQGSVEIYTDNFKTHLANFGPGSSFGEMALIEDQTSSASIRAGDEPVKMIFCDRDLFRDLLAKDFIFAAAFYKGSSLLLSQRLRSMNERIETEIETGKSLIQGMLEASDLGQKLGQTRSAVNLTGSNVFDRLAEQLPALEKLEKEFPEQNVEIKSIKSAVETVLTIDTQNFDIISQQIDQIKQYLKSIQQFITTQEVMAVEGDKNIFNVISDEDSIRQEGGVTFF